MNKLRKKLEALMYGRYGADEFSRFLMYLWIVLVVLNIFVRNIVVLPISILLIAYIYFRVLSFNIEARRRENYAFMKLYGRAGSFFRLLRLRFRDRKTHCYRKCPVCKKMLRLPKRKGRHTAKCPECKNEFEIKIR